MHIKIMPVKWTETLLSDPAGMAEWKRWEY